MSVNNAGRDTFQPVRRCWRPDVPTGGAQLDTGLVSERRNFTSKLIKSMSFADMARIKCVLI